MKLRAKVRVLRLQPPLLDRRVQLVQQLFELKRLGDESLDAEARDLDRLANRSETGDDDRDDLGIPGEGFVKNPTAVDARQPEVGDKNVEGEVVQPLERFFAGCRLFDPEPMIDEPLGHRLAKSAFIVNEQQMLLRNLAHLCGGGILTRPRVLFRQTRGKRSRTSFSMSSAGPHYLHASPLTVFSANSDSLNR